MNGNANQPLFFEVPENETLQLCIDDPKAALEQLQEELNVLNNTIQQIQEHSNPRANPAEPPELISNSYNPHVSYDLSRTTETRGNEGVPKPNARGPPLSSHEAPHKSTKLQIKQRRSRNRPSQAPKQTTALHYLHQIWQQILSLLGIQIPRTRN
eukprot:NODE_1978_length_683_cov_58.539568_g1928_i0.p1 GENE.NODE_1978_length_683_cov_58.539568_g1928_i0~~NODE_1978_length_683_cov_58.539568_g1928_i0.p1  ORF type:complete len:155 (-),score=21.44 NODE_1978_length_683_cov_58.539568_g1928_i0:53-517(-)